MRKPLFIESIKIKDGEFCNLSLHLDRMQKSVKEVLNKTIRFDLSVLQIPMELCSGIVKCRLLYDEEIHTVEFQPYRFKQINHMRVIWNDEIDYSYKRTDRYLIEQMVQQAEADEILIVKNGLLTDTSISNIVLEDDTGLYTPSSYLLAGTKRCFLLKQRVISEKEISIESLSDFHTLHLINAMIDPGEVCLPIRAIER